MVVKNLVFSFVSGRFRATLPPSVTIRRADPILDSESITRVTESCHDDGFPRLRDAGIVAELLGRPDRTVESWLAFRDGSPVGLVSVAVAGEGRRTRHSLAWLLVSRQARRQGIATALVATALESIREGGATEVWVETRADWPAASAFWSAAGFRSPG